MTDDVDDDNDLRELVTEALITDLTEDIEAEWKKLYRNAHLGGYLPDIDDESEWESFWDSLSDFVHCELEYLQDWIKEKFGFELHIYQYGRGGATIAPKEWMDTSYHGHFSKYVRIPYDDVETLGDMLECIKFIDYHIKECCKCIPDWWKETKEINGGSDYE